MRLLIVIVLLLSACEEGGPGHDSVTASLDDCDMYDDATGLCWVGLDCDPQWADPINDVPTDEYGNISIDDYYSLIIEVTYDYCDSLDAAIPTIEQLQNMPTPNVCKDKVASAESIFLATSDDELCMSGHDLGRPSQNNPDTGCYWGEGELGGDGMYYGFDVICVRDTNQPTA